MTVACEIDFHRCRNTFRNCCCNSRQRGRASLLAVDRGGRGRTSVSRRFITFYSAEGFAAQHLSERSSFHGELPGGVGAGGGSVDRSGSVGGQRMGVRAQRSLGPRAESSPVLRRHATVHGNAPPAATPQSRPQHQKHPLVPSAGDPVSRPVRTQEHHGNSRGPTGLNDAPLVRRGSRRLPEVPVNMGSVGRVRVLPRGHRVGVPVGQAEESEEESQQLNYYRRTVH
ncbi:hypothetical protein ONE63_005247 [Megalurothrips usitatus]|uniref:Uncharacterized protein n=1 Tax=Megalurothrips usitatus TaxID=439358 RepID=A0AAV7XZQ8_9NEOP|nr:hypothetical protein ONE63_005247 [Megalurothrips usitatus]